MNPIEISGLVKSFAGHRALDGLDLSLAQGEIHGFLGPNGAGKSTWLGPLVQLDQAVLDLSPFTHVPSIPGDTMSWPPELLLTAVALSLTAIALTGWQHRDIG